MAALAGVRVLDLSRLLPGPFATGVLADMGASVDKIEDPHGGDYLRGLPPLVGEENAAFGILNRGKRSGVLDLKDPRGVAALKRLLPRYDVLFEQFRPGVLGRLGLAPETLMQEHPRLIVCSLTGYGQTGPLRDRAGHDLNYVARSGLLGAQGPAGDAPAPPGFQVADVSGGMWCVIGILGALLERERSGRGKYLDIAMSEGTLPFAVMSLANALAGAGRAHGTDVLTGGIAPYNTYRTKDGRAVALAALEPKFWMAFAAHAGISASLEDLFPGPHQAAGKERLAKLFAEKTLSEWIVWAEGKDCLLEPVLTPEEAVGDAHLTARGMFPASEAPPGSPARRTLRSPVTPESGVSTRRAPRAGEHTREILLEAGLSEAEVTALVEARVAR
ncbi:MAG: CaiB/BaiF CoA-transferase family protein [Polyangiaceae bacterium]